MQYPVKPPADPFTEVAGQLARFVQEDPKRIWNKEYQLAHGICIDAEGRAYADAWLETKNFCLWWGVIRSGEQKGGLVTFIKAKTEFYDERSIGANATVYDWELSVKLAGLHGNLGPWRQEYSSLPLFGGKRSPASKIIFLPPR